MMDAAELEQKLEESQSVTAFSGSPAKRRRGIASRIKNDKNFTEGNYR